MTRGMLGAIGGLVLGVSACSDGGSDAGGAGGGGGEATDGGGPDGGAGTQGGGGAGGSATLPESFACLDGFAAPDPATRVVAIRLQDAVGAVIPPRNPTAVLCAAGDSACETPLDTPVIDETGAFTVEVAPDFEGYLRVTGQVSSRDTDAMPTTIFFKPPVVEPDKELVVRMVDLATFTALAEAAGVTLDPARGHIVALPTDCDDELAEGVAAAGAPVDDDVVPFHFRGALPDPEAPDTDAQGGAGFFNVEPGTFTVTTTLHEGGTFIGTNEVVVEAGGLAFVPIGPTAP